jgi:TadE-like protein
VHGHVTSVRGALDASVREALNVGGVGQDLSAPTRSGDGGAAVADFVLVSALVTLLFLAVFQVGLALHIRNTLIACASEGARYGARADRAPGDGVARARELIRASLADRYADEVSAGATTVGGVAVVEVHASAPLPVLGLLGPDRMLRVAAHAFAENQ